MIEEALLSFELLRGATVVEDQLRREVGDRHRIFGGLSHGLNAPSSKVSPPVLWDLTAGVFDPTDCFQKVVRLMVILYHKWPKRREPAHCPRDIDGGIPRLPAMAFIENRWHTTLEDLLERVNQGGEKQIQRLRPISIVCFA